MKIKATHHTWMLLGLLLVLAGLTAFAQRQIAHARAGNPSLSWRASFAALLGANPKTDTRSGNGAIPRPITADHKPALVTGKPAAGPPANIAVPMQTGGGYSIVKSAIPGGGGTSTGGSNALSGSIGQNAVGTSSGGGFTVSGGFWGGASSSGCQPITITPASLPAGELAQAYSQQLAQTGGGAPLTWSISAGSLPNNITLNSSTGLLSGPPTVSGSFSFTVKITDGNNCMGTQAYTLVIGSCPAISITPASLPLTTSFTFYSQQLTANGGALPYNFTIISGTLPAGLTLAANGLLSGAPTVAGSYSFTMRATDVNGCFGERAYTLTITVNSGLMFYSLATPVRLLDTRPGVSPNACSQPNTPIASGTSLTQLASNFCGIPATAQAITGNITTVASGGGYLTLYPSNATQPLVANSNYAANEIINNVFTVGLGAGDGAFKIFALNTTDVVVDVTGYYAPPSAGGLYFHPLSAPVRLLETRASQSVGCVLPGTPLVGGADSLQTATTACTGISASARAIVGNATTVSPQAGGYLTLFPADVTRPLVASSNYNVDQVVNGPFTVGLSPAGQFKIFTQATTELVVDVLGYYSDDATDANSAGLLFTPLAHPIRLLETRATPPNLPGCVKPNLPLNGNQIYTQPARGLCDGLTIPASALGLVGNATAVSPSVGGYLTLWPGSAAQPLVATSNFIGGQAFNRHFIVGLGSEDGAFKMFSSATTDLVIDLSGYFAP